MDNNRNEDLQLTYILKFDSCMKTIAKERSLGKNILTKIANMGV